MIDPPIAIIAPAVEIVLLVAVTADVGAELIESAENAGFVWMNGVSRPAASHFSLALAYGHNGSVSVLVDVDAIRTGTQNREREIRRVDFKSLIAFKASDANVERAFRQA